MSTNTTEGRPGGRATAAARVEFFFDPGCPWTWQTSRWLTEVGQRQGFDPVWRSFSLQRLQEGPPASERSRARHEAATAALRLFEALRADGRNDVIGAAYAAYGRRVHDALDPPSVDVVAEAAEEVGAEDRLAALTDTHWDDAVAASHDEALALVGGDVGSPVLAITDSTGTRRGFFGPIMAPPPTGDAAVRAWEGVLALVHVPEIAELKRGRGLETELPPAVSAE